MILLTPVRRLVKPRVYIAGPMRGYPQLNFPAFDEACGRWEARGWEVISPADMDRTLDAENPEVPYPFSHYMRRDIKVILTVQALAFLTSWEQSRGARIEYIVGKTLDLQLLDAYNYGPVDTTFAPCIAWQDFASSSQEIHYEH